MAPLDLSVGSPVRQRYTKYDGAAHWSLSGASLGHDRFGFWFGGAPGGTASRPGQSFITDRHWVSLASADRRFILTRNVPIDGRIEFYVDLTTVPVVSRGPDGVLQVDAVDLDLDVVRRTGQVRAWLDDEDEFDEHRVSMDYPAALVAATRAEAERVLTELDAGAEPFGDVSARYLARIQTLLPNDTTT